MADLTPKEIAEQLLAEADIAPDTMPRRLEFFAAQVKRLADPAYRAAWVADWALRCHENGCATCERGPDCDEGHRLWTEHMAAREAARQAYVRGRSEAVAVADIDIDALERLAKAATQAKPGDGRYRFVGDDEVIVMGRTLDALIERLRRAEEVIDIARYLFEPNTCQDAYFVLQAAIEEHDKGHAVAAVADGVIQAARRAAASARGVDADQERVEMPAADIVALREAVDAASERCPACEAILHVKVGFEGRIVSKFRCGSTATEGKILERGRYCSPSADKEDRNG